LRDPETFSSHRLSSRGRQLWEIPSPSPTMSSNSNGTANPQEVKDEVVATEPKQTSQTLAQVRSFVAGGVGGICAVIVGHPFDLVKVRMQTAERGVYTSAMDVVKKTVAREGLARV
jgi:solute carrier family 25 carnitine/acylcarnitine transporter 20/29